MEWTDDIKHRLTPFKITFVNSGFTDAFPVYTENARKTVYTGNTSENPGFTNIIPKWSLSVLGR